MKKITLNTVYKSKPNYKKHFALIDDKHFSKINEHKWSVIVLRKTFYARTQINGKDVYMHSFITGYELTDHVNMNGLDNRECNLREATHSENHMNQVKCPNASSQYKGVSLYKRDNNWSASITHNYKKIHLGYFNTETEAARAYNKKAIEISPEFAHLNNI